MRKQPVHWIGFVVLVLTLGAGASVRGQVTGGTFTGVVKDASGALIPDSKVVVRSVASGVETNVGTSSEGVYTVTFLSAGDYLITAEKPGFKKQVFGPVTLQVNRTVRVDLTLEVGQITEVVEVNATGAQIVQTETGGISQVIVDQQIRQMPLNGRDFQQLIALSPGSVAGAPGESGAASPFNINGQRSRGNNYLIDGVSSITSEGHNNPVITPLDAIQEFSIETNSFSAQYGNAGGGIINLQIRSGTNRWHGSLFEYFRNDKLNANNFFSNAANLSKPVLRYNQFGGSIGFPILRDKTFIFADYSGTRSISPSPSSGTVPLVPERIGDFSNYRTAAGALIPIYDPIISNAPGKTYGIRNQFSYNGVLNVMPPTSIDPAAKKILAAMPLPNVLDASGNVPRNNNWAGINRATDTYNSFDVRFDHNLSAKSQLFVRVTSFRSHSITPPVFGPLLGGTTTGAGQGRNLNTNVGIGHTYTISPTLINEFRVGMNRHIGGRLSFNDGQNTAADFGIPGVNVSPDTTGLPQITLTGYFSLGDSNNIPNRPYDNTYSYSDTLAWVHGRQTIRIGAEAAWYQLNYTILTNGKGVYTYNAPMTSDLTQAFNLGKTAGSSVASFLTGYHSTLVKDALPGGVGLRWPRFAMFLQDDYKASNRLTINLGVRYDIMPSYHDAHDRMANFDPATKTMIVPGGANGRNLRNTDYRNIQPRLGMALALTEDRKTVLRSGYGISFVNMLNYTTDSKTLALNVPYYYKQNTTQYTYGLPSYRLSTGPPPFVFPSATNPDGNVFYQEPKARNAYSQNWTLSIQRAITNTLMTEVAYIGTKGTRLFLPININAAGPGTTSVTSRRPFGSALGTINLYANVGSSIYHGMQLKIEKRFSQGFFLLAHWTWSKTLDNQSTGIDAADAGGVQPQDKNNVAAEWGLAAFDRTHRAVVSPIWEVPYGRGKSYGGQANRILNFVLGGWQLSGILTIESGAPFTIAMSCSIINSEGNCRPNRVASGILPDSQRTLDKWFDPTAFVKVPTTAPAYGNSGRNILRAPGDWVIDMGLSKYFKWGQDDKKRFQFRAEMFNALNHTNWGMPDHSVDSTAIGRISGAGDARQMQLALRFEF